MGRYCKRLAASLAVAGRVAQLTKKECGALACTAARSYRQYMAELAPMPPVVAWSQRIDLVKAVADIDSIKLRRKMQKRLADLLKSGARQFGLVEEHRGGLRIREKPPLVRRLDKHELHARKAFASYAKTLREDRRVHTATVCAPGRGVQSGRRRQRRYILCDRIAGVWQRRTNATADQGGAAISARPICRCL